MEKDILRKEIVLELLIEKLFSCIEINDKGEIEFEKYNMTSKDTLFLLEQYDKEKYDAYCKVLKLKNED